MKKSYEMNMTEGPILGKVIRYSIPLMLSGMLQLLFNAVDTIVVGRCVGDTALAAVGSTGSLVNLIVNLFMGLSVATNIIGAQEYGAKREEDLQDTVHTSVALALIFGIFLMIIGFFFSHTFLTWMGSPDDVIDQATLYLKIYFLGCPAMMLYNFSAAVLRGVGDTKRPMYYLTAAGIINLFLNLFCVLVLHIGVAGVAIATVASQVVSCVLVVRCLIKDKGMIHLDIHKIRIKKEKMIMMLKIGVPSGLQGSMFSISNVLIQSSINSFGSVVMAGNTAASNLEGFVYMAMNTFHQANLSFTGQNLGAGKMKRIKKSMGVCLLLVTIVGLVLGLSGYLFGTQLLHLYTDSEEAISYGLIRLGICCRLYVLCGIMDTIVGGIRGLGSSVMPMIVSLTGVCVLRVVWIYTVFQSYHTINVLYWSYPLSWELTAVVHFICFVYLLKKLQKRYGMRE